MDFNAKKPAGTVQHLSLSAGEFQVHCNSYGNPAFNNNCSNDRNNEKTNYSQNRPAAGFNKVNSCDLEYDDRMLSQHGGQDSYSSGYSGMSESQSSGSPYHQQQDDDDEHSVQSGYLNDYSEVGSCIRRVVRQKVVPGNSVVPAGTPVTGDVDTFTDNETSFSTFTQSTLLGGGDFIYLEKCPKLPDTSRNLPWNENDVLLVLKEGRPKHMSGHITVEMMQRISYLLQRPLIRISKEIKRLSLRINMCTKYEVEAAFKTVLPRSVSHSCQQACSKALTLYTMSGDSLKQSKTARCGLRFSVGKFQRWMVLANVGMRIHEFSAVYLAACVENLLEEIVLRALVNENLGKYATLT